MMQRELVHWLDVLAHLFLAGTFLTFFLLYLGVCILLVWLHLKDD